MFKNSLTKNVEGLVKNKIVLYVIFMFALANAFGYLAMNNYEAFIFFTLVLFVSKEFTNHIGFALICAMVSTNLLLSIVQGRRVYETFVSGMGEENNNTKKDKTEKEKTKKDNTRGQAGKESVKDDDAENFQNDVKKFNNLETMLSHQEGLISSLDRIDSMIDNLKKMSTSVAMEENKRKAK